MTLQPANASLPTAPGETRWWAQVDPDPAMAAVLAGLHSFVSSGDAVLQPLDGDVVELRFHTGEIFHYDATGVTRIA